MFAHLRTPCKEIIAYLKKSCNRMKGINPLLFIYFYQKWKFLNFFTNLYFLKELIQLDE